MTAFFEVDAGVRQLYARYTDAVWRKDHVAFGECFAEDAVWKISGLTFHGRADIAAFMKSVFPRYRFIMLNFRAPILTVGDGTVEARTYVSEQSVMTDGKAYGPLGMYYDRIVEQAGRWRYSWRLFHTCYAGPPDLSGSFFENPDFGAPPAFPPLDAQSFDRTGVLTNKG